MYAMNCRNFYVYDEVSGTLQAKSTGGWSLNYLNPVFQEIEEKTMPDGELTNGYIVRRLMPVECERLQGFPDGHTDLTGFDPEALLAAMPAGEDEKERRKVERNVRKWCASCPDAPRYKACGNSMAVPVIRWLGERIEMVDCLVEDLVMEGY